MPTKAEKRLQHKQARQDKKEEQNSRLIAATPSQGPRITVAEDGEAAYLNWSFQFLQTGWGLEELDCDQAKNFLAGLVQRSKMTWAQINGAGRYGSSCETIPRSQLKVQQVPSVLADDKVLVFREQDLFRFAGFRNGHTFYVLYIDPKGNLYDH
ncbi:MAG: hypothetical protein EOP06_18290 [Proteobacteria bacterium]|nr:MAG: hypothetical protein EOP06_18290 [Pseudomonadota bacterium]